MEIPLKFDNLVITKKKDQTYGIIVYDKTDTEYKLFSKDLDSVINGDLGERTFYDKYGFRHISVVGYGTFARLEPNIIVNYLQFAHIFKPKDCKPLISYKCFCGEQHGLDYHKNILHKTASSAANCLYSYLGYADYFVLFNITNLLGYMIEQNVDESVIRQIQQKVEAFT